MPTVSFCVPVYNRADRVHRCIESLIGQSAARDEYEIIVVDDCSTDGTAEVVQRIFEEHGFANGRVHVLAENSGSASTPRNAAAALARGEYLFFVDSDDYVVPELVEKISECASSFDSDIIYPYYRRETESGEVTSVPHAFARRGDIGRADILDNELLAAMSVLKAFKRSEWERLGITFDPTLRTGEDILVTARFLFNTARHSVIADRAYYAIVDHAADRLTRKPTARGDTFRNYGDILDIIYGGSVGDLEYKHHAAAKFINRIMRVGAGANNAYLLPSASLKTQEEWGRLFAELFAEHFPAEAEAYLSPAFREKVRFLRSGDIVGARFAVEFHDSEASTRGSFEQGLAELARRRAAETHRHVRAGKAVAAAAASKAASKKERELAAELKRLRSSHSWRLTAPLRATVRFVRRGMRATSGAQPVSRKHAIASLRLDEDGRPEVVLDGVSSAGDVAVFAQVSPPDHRNARHRLPLKDAGEGKIAARLPVPTAVGTQVAALSVLVDGDLHPVGRVRRRQHRVVSPELRATATGTGVRIERTASAVPWRRVEQQEVAR